MFALIDCNNFFVSCEQIFRPDLAGKPVVVLSSNDGCAIARSPEAKALGIKMAAPAFKYQDVFKKNNVIQFSANFELYGDISRRITEILTSITPRLEVYSIDESFLDISQLDIADYAQWAQTVRKKIKQWVGVTVSIGVAPTKTLAKLASERAKQSKELNGVLVLSEKEQWQHYLQQTPLEDIWGVGWRMAPRLRANGISTAQDIARLHPTQGRKLFGSVNGERLVRELQGQSCLPLERIHKEQKMISATRTFGRDTSEAHVVEAALASFVARAASRLRSQNSLTNRLNVFLASDRHKPEYRKWSREVRLTQPTADTGYLTALANQLFSEMYESNALYHRGGVLLSDFSPDASLQTDILGTRDTDAFDASKRRMKAIDSLHQKYDKRIVRYASEDLAISWEPKRNIRSPRYTTSWDELPQIKIQ
jgi:DNA polymerase V